MSNKTKKMSVLVNSMLKKGLLDGFNEKELANFLDWTDRSSDHEVVAKGLSALSNRTSKNEEMFRKLRIALEDLISVVSTAYRNGCLDKLVENGATPEQAVVVMDGKPISDEQFDKLDAKTQQRILDERDKCSQLFTKKGMESFVYFAEKKLPKMWNQMWQAIDFSDTILNSLSFFLSASADELQKASEIVDKKQENLTSVSKLPNVAPSKEELN